MEPIAQYTAYLERTLTPSRMRHSLGVMQTMGELAEIYNLDRVSARIAGLLHDAAKDLTLAQQTQAIVDSGIEWADPCEAVDYAAYGHGPVGAFWVEKHLCVHDTLILEAIYRHTWCGVEPEFAHPLVWCLRFADILEPNRNWDVKAREIRAGEPELRKAVYAGRLEQAAFLQTAILIRFMEDNGQAVHPNYRFVYERLASRQPIQSTYIAK